MLQFNATFIVAIFSFVVFIIIMNRILYKPISAIVNERENLINGNYSDAKNSLAKSESIYNERNEKLSEAKVNSRKIISDKLDKARIEAKKLTETAFENSRFKIDKAKDELYVKEADSKMLLQKEAESLSDLITEKLTGVKAVSDSQAGS